MDSSTILQDIGGAVTAMAEGAATGAATAAASGPVAGIIAGAETAAKVAAVDLPGTVGGLVDRVGALEAKAALFEKSHPVIGGLLDLLGKYFPHEVDPIRALLQV